jgi:hypothetical protein
MIPLVSLKRIHAIACNFAAAIRSNHRQERRVVTNIFAPANQLPRQERQAHTMRGPNLERYSSMKHHSANTLALAAAFAGLLGGTTARLNAQPAQQGSISAVRATSNPGVLLVAQNQPAPEIAKHSCKGKNDCKGQGGGKDAGKNDCKGKGGCATDGSTPPKAS